MGEAAKDFNDVSKVELKRFTINGLSYSKDGLSYDFKKT